MSWLHSVATIAWRELGSLLRVPVGWIVIALFCLLAAIVFVNETLAPGSPATLRYFFATSSLMLVPVAPAISMRLLSEELRSGSIEPLRTAPIGDAAVVWGKYAGAVLFLLLMLVPTLVFPAVLFIVSEPAPDLGPIIAGYLSLILAGMLYLAIGLLASSLTNSQTLAYLGTLMFLVLVVLLTTRLTGDLPTWAKDALEVASIPRRVGEFAKGVIDSAHIVFFLTVSAWFVVMATASLEARRWA